MRCLISDNSNPYFNLATEEYFLKNTNEEIFMLYVNEPCIVVGKHQNLLSEVNLPYLRENNIKVARRISGGGTVYHDFNNLNFSFIHNCENREQISFTKFTTPILNALREMGINAEFSGRNDLLIGSKKISGNAMHIYKTRVLSHGTLLFATDLTRLSSALKSNSDRFTDRSIKSVRSPVTNISGYLGAGTTIDKFTQDIFHNITDKFGGLSVNPLSISEVEKIKKIALEKFESWDWIYGYSPKYVFNNIFQLFENKIHLRLEVEKGLISKVDLKLIPENLALETKLRENLTGIKHDYEVLVHKFDTNPINISDSKVTITEFCSALF